MKKLIVMFILLSLSGCSLINDSEIFKYESAIIVTTQNSKKSYITYFDENLNEVKTESVPYPTLGSHFDQPIYKDNIMYLVPTGLSGKSDEKKVVSLDLKSGLLKEYGVDRINILKTSVNDKYIYTMSNLNGVEYLSQINKDSKLINEITDTNYHMNLIVCIKNKVCLFESRDKNNKEQSIIKIFDVNLKLLETVDITNIGSLQLKFTIKDNLLFFSNNYLNGKNHNTIGVLNIDDYSLDTIELKKENPSDIIIDKDYLFVCHTSEIDPKGQTIAVVNLKNYKDIKEYNLKHEIIRMEKSGKYIFILSPVNENGYLEITKYSLNEMKEISTKKIRVDDGFYPSVLFVKEP